MDVATAMMVFLSCSPGSDACQEILGTRTYQDSAACREALPAVLQSMNGAGRHVIGRCTLAADVHPDLDQIITGSTASGAMAGEGYAVVRVTRIKDGTPETTSYKVPQAR